MFVSPSEGENILYSNSLIFLNSEVAVTPKTLCTCVVSIFFSLRGAVLRVLGVCSELVSYLRAEILSCKEKKNELSRCQ